MFIKTICILANSIKKSGHCVAGIELDYSNGQINPGPKSWVRPISSRLDGELAKCEMKLNQQGQTVQPKVLDVVDVPLLRPASMTGQPENWLIDPSREWVHRGSLNPQQLSCLVQEPDDLWLDQRYRPDRVSPPFIQQNEVPSLYLVRVQNFRIEIVEKTDYATRQPVKKRRAKFRYRDACYDLAVTDPVVQQKYFARFPNVAIGLIEPGPEKDCTLCISLSPEFNGYHYKLVAAVIS